jgi:hypothetical protein
MKENEIGKHSTDVNLGDKKELPIPYFFWGVIVLSLLISLLFRFDFDFNGGHIDEYDYLFVAKLLLAGETWNTYSYIFGSDLNWYTLGLGEQFGGLTGGRMVSALFGILSLLGLYWLTLLLWNSKPIALLATALLALQASHMFSSKFATYDIIALAYLSLTLPMMWKASSTQGKERIIWELLSILLFVLAVTSKYVVAAYYPLLVLIAFWRSPWYGFSFGLLTGMILSTYLWFFWEDLKILYEVQILGTHAANTTYTEILYRLGTYLTMPLFLCFMAIGWVMWGKEHALGGQKTIITFMVLLVLALPLAAYHLNGRNVISLYKHTVYGLYFLAPIMAWLMWNLLVNLRCKNRMQFLLMVVTLGITLYNILLLQEMERGYPDMRLVAKEFETIPVDENTTVASEDPYLLRYILFDKLPQSHIKELYWMDNNRDGNYTLQDTLDALWDRKFSYVVLCDLLRPKENEKVREILNLRDYEEVLTIPWEISREMGYSPSGTTRLYKRTVAPTINTKEDRMFTPLESFH